MKNWQVLIMIGGIAWLTWWGQECTNHIMEGLRTIAEKIEEVKAKQDE